MSSFRVAVDIGGTFTDVAVLDETVGSITVSKVPTTPRNFVIGFLNGIRKSNAPHKDTSYLIHGTTVATNSVVQRKLPVTALLMTKGFRDVLEIPSDTVQYRNHFSFTDRRFRIPLRFKNLH
jgi:N-methylhydantoinase A